MRTAAITGAAGFLGRHLLHAFASAGWRVIGLCRRPGEHAAAGSVSYAYFDLRNAAEINLDGVDTLIHCAIEPYRRIGNPSASINVTGSSSLFERARSEGVRKIVFISSTASRAETQSEYGLEKFAVENLLDPHRDLTVRPGLVVIDPMQIVYRIRGRNHRQHRKCGDHRTPPRPSPGRQADGHCQADRQ